MNVLASFADRVVLTPPVSMAPPKVKGRDLQLLNNTELSKLSDFGGYSSQTTEVYLKRLLGALIDD